MAFLSSRSSTIVITIVFYGAALFAVFRLPDRMILPVAIAAGAIGFGALYGTREYLRRLQPVVKILKSAEERVPMALPSNLLTPRELAFLGLTGTREPDVHLAAFRRREERIISVGVFFGMMGMCSILVLILVYGD